MSSSWIKNLEVCSFCWLNVFDTLLVLQWVYSQALPGSWMDSSAWYYAVFEEELKPTVCSKFSALLRKGVVMHHDNSCSHTAAGTVEVIQKFKFKLLPYTTFGPDLYPFDYQIFGLLKVVMLGCQFSKCEEVKVVVCMWVSTQPKLFCSNDIMNFMD